MWPSEVETPFYRSVLRIFQYFEPFRRGSQTDGQSDFPISNAALNYVARPKVDKY